MNYDYNYKFPKFLSWLIDELACISALALPHDLWALSIIYQLQPCTQSTLLWWFLALHLKGSIHWQKTQSRMPSLQSMLDATILALPELTMAYMNGVISLCVSSLAAGAYVFQEFTCHTGSCSDWFVILTHTHSASASPRRPSCLTVHASRYGPWYTVATCDICSSLQVGTWCSWYLIICRHLLKLSVRFPQLRVCYSLWIDQIEHQEAVSTSVMQLSQVIQPVNSKLWANQSGTSSKTLWCLANSQRQPHLLLGLNGLKPAVSASLICKSATIHLMPVSSRYDYYNEKK